MYKKDHILLDQKVYLLTRIAHASGAYFILLHEVAACLSVDKLGAYYVEHITAVDHLPSRFMHVSAGCQITGTWSFHDGMRVYLVPKY